MTQVGMMTASILAIDFGTSTSAAILVSGSREDQVEDPSSHDRAWPTAVCAVDGKLVVGTIAEQSKRIYPERYRTEFKPELGRAHPVDLGGQSETMTSLVTAFLIAMKEEAERVAGAPVSRAVLTMPASYVTHDKRRELMLAAAAAAGFELTDLLPEPVAAALAPAAGPAIGAGSLLLVYDFGGGTFDTALVRVGASTNRVLGSASIENGCGGRDIDSAIADYLVATGGSGLVAALARSERDPLQFSTQVKELKHQLSNAGIETAKDVFGSAEIPISITRDKLNELTEPLLNRTLECVEDLLSGCEVALEDVDVVLMVGGVTRMPIVEQTVQKRLGRPPRNARSPELAVVQGAARFAAAAATRFVVPRPRRIPEVPLRWDIPGDGATLLEHLAGTGDVFAPGQVIGRVRLDSGAIWELRAGAAGRLRDWHAAPGATVFAGDWLVTAEALPPPLLALPVEAWSKQHAADVITFSPDGTTFATDGKDHYARVWTLGQSIEVRAVPNRSPILAIAYSRGGTLFAAGTRSGGACVWDFEGGGAPRQFSRGMTVSGVAFSPDGTHLLTGGDCLYLWNLAADTRTMLRAGATQGVAFSPDGRVVVAAFPGERKTLVIDVATRAVLAEADSGDGTGLVALSPDGARFAAGRDAQSLAIRDTASGDLVTVLPHVGAWCAAFSPDGTLCLTGGAGTAALLWDAATGQCVGAIPDVGARAVAFSPGGDLVGLADSGNGIRIWRII
jgi:actin-like ATPase involved in cell morphogenesis